MGTSFVLLMAVFLAGAPRGTPPNEPPTRAFPPDAAAATRVSGFNPAAEAAKMGRERERAGQC